MDHEQKDVEKLWFKTSMLWVTEGQSHQKSVMKKQKLGAIYIEEVMKNFFVLQ